MRIEKPSQLHPGQALAVCYPLYRHYTIVSDQYAGDWPMLISLSQRTGRVCEESWQDATQNRPVVSTDIQGELTPDEVLARAREKIGDDLSKWNLFSNNCEHFAHYAHGLDRKSQQLHDVVQGALIGAATTLLFPKVTAARILLFAASGALIRVSQKGQQIRQ